jgi:acetylornithine aminotransferase
VFNGAGGSTMFTGELHDLTAVLDLGMVFGSRLWGHDQPPLEQHDLGAPGVGDLFTHELRERANTALCERVARELQVEPSELRALVLHTGSEAVETAIKTALRATSRDKVLAYKGGYHGTFGLALAVTHRDEFRAPFANQYADDTVRWARWGMVPALDPGTACVVVEPWQGRAGVVPPPAGFLPLLREECDRVGAALILDAVLCGSGRTGPVLVEAIRDARPAIVCLGKALGCGLTASAVVCRADLASAAWDRGAVEPAHTSTSIGDPVACAGILRTLVRLEHRRQELIEASAAWHACLESVVLASRMKLRGKGLLWALDTERAGGGVRLAQRLLAEHRMLVVPSGPDGSSITLYPPTVCTDLERERFVEACVAVAGG